MFFIWSFGVILLKVYYKDVEEFLLVVREVCEKNMFCDVIILDGCVW